MAHLPVLAEEETVVKIGGLLVSDLELEPGLGPEPELEPEPEPYFAYVQLDLVADLEAVGGTLEIQIPQTEHHWCWVSRQILIVAKRLEVYSMLGVSTWGIASERH
jgi:hypothetical protein